MRESLRALAATVAVVCLGIAAVPAFDWVDYGLDSTCGSLIQRKSVVGPCADIMRNRLIGVVALVAVAIMLAVVAARPRRATRSS